MTSTEFNDANNLENKQLSKKEDSSAYVLNRMLASLTRGDNQQITILLELGQEVATILSNQSEEKKKENLDLAQGFLDCSKEDIGVTRILYEKNHMAPSIYHLQQAVEKATKAYALAFFAITKEELIKIGHKSPLTFIRMLNRSWVKKYIDIMKIFYPDLKTNISEVEKIINLRKTQEELARLPKSVILSYLNLNDKIRSTLETTETLKVMYSQIEQLLGSLKGLITDKKAVDVLKTLRTNFRFDMVCSFAGLYVLSVITYPHSAFTRYPDGRMKPSDYSTDIGIVESVNEILSQVESGITILEDYLTNAM